jgi:hypothetical protein
MNHYGQIIEEIKRQYDRFSDAVEVSPSSLAWAVHELLSSGMESDVTRYLSLEQLKQMSREFLRRSKDADGDENATHSAQGNLDLGIKFSGKLQDRYPVPRKAGEEPVYKRRQDLTQYERQWNETQLRKSGQARIEHADALRAEGMRQEAA